MPYFVLLSGTCVNDETGEERYRSVWMRFKDEKQFMIAEGDMLDTTYTSFNEDLPDGWHADDVDVLEVGVFVDFYQPSKFVDYKAD